MKALFKWIHSPDVSDLEKFNPEEKFGFLLQIFVGSDETDGEESFDLFLCSPSCISEKMKGTEILVGHHYLIMQKYDYEKLIHFIQNFCEQCIGETWDEVAKKLSRIGIWEFEDYRRQ